MELSTLCANEVEIKDLGRCNQIPIPLQLISVFEPKELKEKIAKELSTSLNLCTRIGP